MEYPLSEAKSLIVCIQFGNWNISVATMVVSSYLLSSRTEVWGSCCQQMHIWSNICTQAGEKSVYEYERWTFV